MITRKPTGSLAVTQTATAPAPRSIRRNGKATPLASGTVAPGTIQHIADIAATTNHVETEVVTITPDMAREWLERGGENRPISQGSVNRYAQSMKDGEWRLTGESIKLDTQGLVRDGQHRLWACIESNVPFVTMVTVNIPSDAFDVMDSGRARSNSDIVALHGFNNSKQTAAVARYSVIWDKTGTPAGDSWKFIPSKPAILAWLEQHDSDVQEWVTLSRAVCRARIGGGEGIWGTVLHKFAHIDPAATRLFVDGLVSGTDMQAGDARLTLRNRLLGATRLPPNEVAAFAIKAWNAYRAGRRMHVLRWNKAGAQKESFPRIES